MVKIEKYKDIVKFMNQFDFHVHSFSRCVLKKRSDIEDYMLSGWSLSTKEAFIMFSLETICDEAERKGVKMLGIAEHPQFGLYNVPYANYRRAFEAVKDNVKDRLHILSGIELNLKYKGGEFYLDLDEVADGNQSWRQIIGSLDFIIGSAHFRDLVDDRYTKNPIDDKNVMNRGFHVNAVKAVISEMAKLKRKKAGKGKVYILGHPMSSFGEANNVYFERNRDTDNFQYQQYSEYLKSKDIAIRFFTPRALTEISEMLYSNKIYPEFNSSSIKKKFSDLRSREPFPKTLLEAYIKKGIEKGRIPMTIPSSDAHVIEDIGNMRADIVKKRVPKFYKARVPYEYFLSR